MVKGRLEILELMNMIRVLMLLDAIVWLNVVDAIWKGSANALLSSAKILERSLLTGTGDVENL